MPLAHTTLRPLLAVLFVVSLMPACGFDPEPSGPTHVILISLDTLRRDHVGTYGATEGVSTPNLDGLAESAVVFENAFAPVPFTLPSHMSMLTGLKPEVHGVQGSRSRLSPHVSTLAESLSAVGYRTIGLVTNLWMKGEFGFARGFDHYQRLPSGLTYSDRVNQRIFELLDSLPGDDRPIFLFLHYVDPHSDFFRVANNTLPYYSPTEFLDKTGVKAESREFCDEQEKCATNYLLAINREGYSVSPTRLEKIKALYRSGIEYLDRDLGVLFAGLRERGQWENSLVILTSDHGEEFLEHGEFIHSQPYVENLAIPLLIRLPADRYAGTRRPDMVQLVDLLPTILDWLGLGVPEATQRRSLVPLIRGERLSPGVALGRDKKNRKRFVLRTEQYTLIHDFASGLSELYDRRTDPDENTNLQAQEPDRVARLLSGLETLLAENRRAASQIEIGRQDGDIFGEEEEEKLRAIGYLE